MLLYPLTFMKSHNLIQAILYTVESRRIRQNPVQHSQSCGDHRFFDKPVHAINLDCKSQVYSLLLHWGCISGPVFSMQPDCFGLYIKSNTARFKLNIIQLL